MLAVVASTALERVDRFGRVAGHVGEIGDATYLRSLFIMGYASRDAAAELNLLKMERK